MSLPSGSDLQKLDYAFNGSPFVVYTKNGSDKTLDYAFAGMPFTVAVNTVTLITKSVSASSSIADNRIINYIRTKTQNSAITRIKQGLITKSKSITVSVAMVALRTAVVARNVTQNLGTVATKTLHRIRNVAASMVANKYLFFSMNRAVSSISSVNAVVAKIFIHTATVTCSLTASRIKAVMRVVNKSLIAVTNAIRPDSSYFLERSLISTTGANKARAFLLNKNVVLSNSITKKILRRLLLVLPTLTSDSTASITKKHGFSKLITLQVPTIIKFIRALTHAVIKRQGTALQGLMFICLFKQTVSSSAARKSTDLFRQRAVLLSPSRVVSKAFTKTIVVNISSIISRTRLLFKKILISLGSSVKRIRTVTLIRKINESTSLRVSKFFTRLRIVTVDQSLSFIKNYLRLRKAVSFVILNDNRALIKIRTLIANTSLTRLAIPKNTYFVQSLIIPSKMRVVGIIKNIGQGSTVVTIAILAIVKKLSISLTVFLLRKIGKLRTVFQSLILLKKISVSKIALVISLITVRILRTFSFKILFIQSQSVLSIRMIQKMELLLETSLATRGQLIQKLAAKLSNIVISSSRRLFKQIALGVSKTSLAIKQIQYTRIVNLISIETVIRITGYFKLIAVGSISLLKRTVIKPFTRSVTISLTVSRKLNKIISVIVTALIKILRLLMIVKSMPVTISTGVKRIILLSKTGSSNLTTAFRRQINFVKLLLLITTLQKIRDLIIIRAIIQFTVLQRFRSLNFVRATGSEVIATARNFFNHLLLAFVTQSVIIIREKIFGKVIGILVSPLLVFLKVVFGLAKSNPKFTLKLKKRIREFIIKVRK